MSAVTAQTCSDTFGWTRVISDALQTCPDELRQGKMDQATGSDEFGWVEAISELI